MAQIRIYLDGTFESVAAAKDPKAELAALKADLKTITKVEGLRVKREAAKKAGNKEKDKDLLSQIKGLKKTLSSPRNSTAKIVQDKIAKLGAAPAKPDLKAKLASRQTKAVRAPKKPSNSEERVKAARPARQTAKVKARLRDLETKIGILEHDLSKVPKGAKYNLRREMLSENLADAKKQVQSLEHTGKEAILPARTSAPLKKRRIARETEEDAVGRRKRQAIELITDKMAQTRDPVKLAALKAQLLKAQTGPDRAPLTKEERAARAAKPAAKPRAKSKDEKALDRVHEAENALIKYREGKSVHDKIRPGDKVAKAEMREMEQLMADLPEAKTNYRKMPKSAVMQKSRDNAKKMIDAMEKRLDMLKKKYIGQSKK